MKILIDNGHGIDTLGKCSPDGTFREYRYTREIASLLVGALRKDGYDASLLVPEDNDVPLDVRVKRVNAICDEYGKDNVLLVSIHCNASGRDGQWHDARGWGAYTTKGFTESDILADYLYTAAEQVFSKDKGLKIRRNTNSLYGKDKEQNFYILHKTRCAAVLTENFFQDNQEDVRYLTSKSGKSDIVKVHHMGIVNYINS